MESKGEELVVQDEVEAVVLGVCAEMAPNSVGGDGRSLPLSWL